MVAEDSKHESDRPEQQGVGGRSRWINFVAFSIPFAIATIWLVYFNESAFDLFHGLDRSGSEVAVGSLGDDGAFYPPDASDRVEYKNLGDGSMTVSVSASNTKKNSLLETSSVDGLSDREGLEKDTKRSDLSESVAESDEFSVLNSESERDDFSCAFSSDESANGNSSENNAKVENEIVQLSFQFSQLKERDVRDLYEIEEALEPISARIREYIKIEGLASDTSEKIVALQKEVDAFRDLLIVNRSFYQNLESFDEASLNAASSRAFLAKYSASAPEDYSGETEADSYCRDLVAVTRTLDALDRVDSWNDFIARNGATLEHFYVSPDAASQALSFLKEHTSDDGVPCEFNLLKRRSSEWRFTVSNNVSIQRKVLLRIEAELSKKYWTYAASDNKFYYLDAPARSGSNEYIADENGTLRVVDIPADAPEIGLKESPQKEFLSFLFERVNAISDDLRRDDAARWYAEWCDLLRSVQTTDRLDPIVQYSLFRDVARILSQGDYFFSRRLAPMLRMLNAPQLEEDADLARWKADDAKTQELRALARGRASFLPNDHLNVDKTTSQLDSQIEPCSFVYERVGWLDRSFSGVWICRRPDGTALPSGELFALRQETSDRPSFVWRNVGVSDGKQLTIKLASNELPRGTIVFCRVRAGENEQIARRSDIEKLFRR